MRKAKAELEHAYLRRKKLTDTVKGEMLETLGVIMEALTKVGCSPHQCYDVPPLIKTLGLTMESLTHKNENSKIVVATRLQSQD